MCCAGPWSVGTSNERTTRQDRCAIGRVGEHVRQPLQAMVRRAPQVIVKLVRAPKGMKGISNKLTYISCDGLLEIEDQDGQVIKGKEAVADLKTEWQHADRCGFHDARRLSSRPLHAATDRSVVCSTGRS